MKKSRNTKPKLLKEYQAKRKFHETPEPAGKVIKKSGELRYVVHKHAASRLHYDLRLEMDGVYRSWAVPKGPTLNPSEQRLAVRVEDHPIEYGDFEGIIPEGNYGAGTVMIWDRGVLKSRAIPDDRKAGEKDLLNGYSEGHITFLMEGEKLHGEFALVRLKRGDPKAWLLVKKRDKFASSKKMLHDRSVITGRTMPEIAAEAENDGKVWKSGRKAGPVKKTAEERPKSNQPAKKLPAQVSKPEWPKNAFPHRVKLTQGILLSAAPEATSDFVFAPSWNAIRAIAEIEKGKVSIYSKSFLPLHRRHPEVLKSLCEIKQDVVLDGEIYGEKFHISDLIFANGKDLRALPVEERLRSLEKLSLPGCTPFTDLQTAIQSAAKLGADFIVGKKKKSTYDGGLSKQWIRFSASQSSEDPADQTPQLTHTEKIYFPDDGFTKGDLISYYDSIADLILPYLVDRPESMHRQPDGIKSAGFFHKDFSGFAPKRVKTHRVSSASSGKTLNYLLCQDRWTLLYMANLGCIELNPWLSRIPNLDNPDYMVIDLDPDDNSYDEVVEIAQAFKELLDSIGAESFCKTSGASGMHICVPTQGNYDFDETRIFAEMLCRHVQQQFPRNTSVERTPAKRRRKIYLDFLQNRRGQTLAAPYCVRPRPGATVSTPLKWSEVKKGLSPEAFTIQTIRKRVAKLGDLWKPMRSVSVDLAKCRKRFEKL